MKRYDSYKDSGVEWIGLIPSGWDKTKLSYLMENDGFRSGPFGSSLITSQLFDKGRVRVLSPEFIYKGKEDFPLFVPEERENELSKYLVKEGDIVIPIVGTIGRGRVIKKEDPVGILNQRLCRITPNKKKVNLSFLHLLLTESHLVKVQYSLEKRGSILDHITKEILFNFHLPLPPLKEQHQIVEYLDNKTSSIDSLIQSKEKKITLLKEKRTSLINQVITKGLNPDVEMKDSGVEWIGEIPKGWEFSKIRYITQEHRQGYYSSDSYSDSGFRVVRITDLNDDRTISVDNSPFYELNDEDLKRFLLKKDDFLFPRTGGVGRFGVFNNSPDSIYGSFLIRFRFNKQVLSRFMRYYFDSFYYLNQILSMIHGGVNKNVHVENIKDCKILLPPLNEQHQIIEYLDKETKLIDETISSEQKKIELLKEYKQSLISEVVTGKRKVVN